MPIDSWKVLIEHVAKIESLAASEAWDDVLSESKILEIEFRDFFDKKIDSIDYNDQVEIKEEGSEVVARISQIISDAKQAKLNIANESKKIAKGSKGISAYTNSR